MMGYAISEYYLAFLNSIDNPSTITEFCRSNPIVVKTIGVLGGGIFGREIASDAGNGLDNLLKQIENS